MLRHMAAGTSVLVIWVSRPFMAIEYHFVHVQYISPK